MNEQNLECVLKIIIEKLDGANVQWSLDGSANLFIQGVSVTVRDLDITTNREGIEIFREKLKEFIVKAFFSPKIQGLSIICDINGFEVEINAYGDRPEGMQDKTKYISWRNLSVPVLPLRSALEFYRLVNYEDKVKLIEKHISNQ
ncbi:MAG: nucleotidyltransferase domain-containing protein [Candidatus Nanoarchaeia archaeon]